MSLSTPVGHSHYLRGVGALHKVGQTAARSWDESNADAFEYIEHFSKSEHR